MAVQALPVDKAQVKKEAMALLAYLKTKEKAGKLLLNENENVYLMVTVWKIPHNEQVIKIPLPHGIRPDTSEVCLFTKDEPNLSAEQTENMYKQLLIRNGITNISQIISYKTLKAEYKPYEAKRRLLSRFDLFLSDDRIRRLLPSHIGKHFYRSKKAPLSVNLKAKNLAHELNKHIQGTILSVTNKGSCYTARIGHSGMKADEIAENILTAAGVISSKLPKNWKNIKVLHLKACTSVALPIYTSSLHNLDDLDNQPSIHKKAGKKTKGKERKQKKVTAQTSGKPEVKAAKKKNTPAFKMLQKEPKGTIKIPTIEEPGVNEREEIPQLVPIQTSASVDGQEVVKPNCTPGKNVGTNGKTRTLLGKRKSPLPQVTPPVQLKMAEKAELQTHSQGKQARKLSTPKEAVKEKELRETPKKPEAKSFVALKREKIVKSAKKAPKTPKQILKKMKVAQSA
uniref:Ribosomal L1 domain-containing protein 1 n=1 Tax=Sphenodon punctatus TaxID=8508 RepID=A0A8D0GU21_SPHPU